MNENLCFFVCIFVLHITLLVTGCCTYTPVDNNVLDHSQQLANLEAGIRDYGRTVESVITDIEAVRERASKSGSTIHETILLFDSYQRAVERLLQDYNRLRAEIENAKTVSDSTDNNPSD